MKIHPHPLLKAMPLIFIMILGKCLIAQEHSAGFYIDAGTGVYNRYTNFKFGRTLGLDGGVFLDRHMISASFMMGAESTTSRAFKSYDLLYGRTIELEEIRVHGQAGLGLVQYRNFVLFHNTIGIPLRAGMEGFLNENFAIGFDLFFNANLVMPYWGAAIKFEIGMLNR